MLCDTYGSLPTSRSAFFWPGHPGADFLADAGHDDVVLFFEDAVDAERARHFVLEQAGALGDGSRDVGGDVVHRVIVSVEDVLPAQHRLARRRHAGLSLAWR